MSVVVELRLQFPPFPERMGDHAALIIEPTLRLTGRTLDYSAGSLTVVDHILNNFHAEGTPSEQIGETLFAFGAYLGEVLVRSTWGTWTRLPPDHPLDASWPVVQVREGSLCNPIGKVFKRVDNGEVDSITHFFTVFAE